MKPSRIALFATGAWLAIATLSSAAVWAESNSSLPAFDDVEQYIRRHFQARPSYQPGDLITRSSAADVLQSIGTMGWNVANQNSILASILSDADFIARQFRTPEGERFMRKISAYEMGYDRLERLLQLPNGRKTVYELIHGKGGHKLVEYMTESQGGKNMGKMLSRTSGGSQFNQPTGRIYTVDGLIERLRASYQQTQSDGADQGI